MKTKLTFLFAVLLTGCVLARPLLITWTPNPQDVQAGIVREYSLWYQPTNALGSNSYQWVAQTPINTVTVQWQSLTLDSTNLPPNCYLFVTADGISQQSPWSAPYLYNYTNLLQNIKPQAVTGVGAVLQ